MQLSEPHAGAIERRAGAASIPVALGWAASSCWWLTLALVTLNAGWRFQPAGAGSGMLIYWFDVPLISTLLCWALALAFDPTPALRLGPRVPVTALAGLALLAIISAGIASRPHYALAMGARLIMALLFFLFTLNSLAGENHATPRLPRAIVSPAAFACALLVGLAVQGIVAGGQVARQAALGLGLLGERAISVLTPGVAVVDLHGRHVLRPYGLTPHPNVLGGFLAASLLPLAVWLPRRIGVMAASLALLLLAMTVSRGACLAAAAAVAAFAAATRVRLPATRIVLAAALLCVAAAVLTPLGSLFAARLDWRDPLEQFSVGERIAAQSAAWHLIQGHLILGVGADNYLSAAAQAAGAGIGAYVPVAHNAFLLAAAEVGVAGAALLAVALLWPGWRAVRRGRGGRGDPVAAAALAGCAVLGSVDYYVWSYPAFVVLWATLLAIWAAGEASARGAATPAIGMERGVA